MSKLWKFSYEIKMADGEQRGGWNIKAWTASDAIREIAKMLQKTAKDDRAKSMKSITVTLTQKGD